MLHKRFDFTKEGGFPLTQEVLDFMQSAATDISAAIPAICGNNSIVAGMNINSPQITDGLVIYNNELLPFVGGNYAGGNWKLVEKSIQVIFGDNTQKTVKFERFLTVPSSADGGATFYVNFTRVTDLKTFWQDYSTFKSNYTAAVGNQIININNEWKVGSGTSQLRVTKKFGKIVHLEGVFRITTSAYGGQNFLLDNFPYQLVENDIHVASVVLEDTSQPNMRFAAIRNIQAQNIEGGIKLMCTYFSVETNPLQWSAMNVFVNHDFKIL